MRPGIIASAKVAAAPAGGAMAISGNGHLLSRSASGLTGSITMSCWVKLGSDLNTYQIALGADDGGSNYVWLGAASNGTSLALISGSGGISTAFDFTPGVWTFVCFTLDTVGALDYMYRAVAPAITVTADYIFTLPTGWNNANTLRIGNNGFGYPWVGSIAAVKIWNAALTQAEVTAELPKRAAQRTANLWAAYGLGAGPQTADDSGNGRTLTITGTPTLDASGPPIT